MAGMVGALSIVRFRAAVKDPRDIVYIFWAISIGLAAGSGGYRIAIIATLMIGIVQIIMKSDISFFKKHGSYMLVVKANEIPQGEIEEFLKGAGHRFRLKMRNRTGTVDELIYEVQLAAGAEEEISAALEKLIPEGSFHLLSHASENIS